MHTTKAARRYAKALMGMAKELDQVDSIYNDMDLIYSTISASRELVLFLKSPVVKSSNKKSVLKQVFSEKVSQSTNQFFTLMIDKDREDQLGEIAAAYHKLYDDYKEIQQIEVVVAHQLDENQEKELRENLEKRTGKTVRMNVTVSESIRGGAKVRIEDTVIDGSVKYKLEEMRQLLYETNSN